VLDGIIEHRDELIALARFRRAVSLA
jgi:hypothetical protein